MLSRMLQTLRAAGAGAALSAAAVAPAFATSLPPAPAAVESFDAGTLHVDRYGTGKRPLILVPGLGCGPWEWYGTIAHFSSAYDIYALTLPGFDGRPAVAESDLFAAFYRDAALLIRTRKLDRPAIVGHSIGGTLALAFGERQPALTGPIVAVDGLPVFPALAFATADARTKAASSVSGTFIGLAPAAFEKSEERYMATIGTADPTLVDPTAELEARSDPNAVAAWANADLASDFRPDLAKIASPVLEIVPYNAADRTAPPANYTQDQTLDFYRSLLGGVTNLTVTPIPNARHFAMLDQPDAFYGVLGAYLAGH